MAESHSRNSSNGFILELDIGYCGVAAITPRHISSEDPSPHVMYRGGKDFNCGIFWRSVGSNVHLTRIVSPATTFTGVFKTVADWSSKL